MANDKSYECVLRAHFITNAAQSSAAALPMQSSSDGVHPNVQRSTLDELSSTSSLATLPRLPWLNKPIGIDSVRKSLDTLGSKCGDLGSRFPPLATSSHPADYPALALAASRPSRVKTTSTQQPTIPELLYYVFSTASSSFFAARKQLYLWCARQPAHIDCL
jgi:hypothetical protein